MPNKPTKNKDWSFAIGTCSIVPGSNGREHYLIADIDDKDELTATLAALVKCGVHNVHYQETKRGFHLFTDYRCSFNSVYRILRTIPSVDSVWLSIGRKRGYLFLADQDAIILPWQVTRMRLKKREESF